MRRFRNKEWLVQQTRGSGAELPGNRARQKYCKPSQPCLNHKEIPARKIEKYYIGIANTRNENLIKDPVQFIRSTNDYINSLFEEIENDTNAESRTKSQKILAQTLLTEQTRIGVPLSKQKVMSNSMAAKFVTQFKELGFDKRCFHQL